MCGDLIDGPIAAVGEKVYVMWATNKTRNQKLEGSCYAMQSLFDTLDLSKNMSSR